MQRTSYTAQHSVSASPEAKLYYYRGPSRRIPSPANILSIDRRDEDAEGVYEAQPSQRSATKHEEGPRGSSSGVAGVTAAWSARGDVAAQAAALRYSTERHTLPAEAQERDEEDDSFFFYNPEWTRGGDRSWGAGRSASHDSLPRSSAAARRPGHRHPSRSRDRYGATGERSTRGVHHAVNSEATVQDSRESDSPAAASHDEVRRKYKHLRRLFKSYQRQVATELEPELVRLRAALRDKEAECARLAADNVNLSQQLQRLHHGGVSTSHPMAPGDKSSRPGHSDDLPFAMAAPVPVVQEAAHRSAEVTPQLQEAAAEVSLLRRQLARLQDDYDRLEQHVEQGGPHSPLRHSATATRGTAGPLAPSAGAVADADSLAAATAACFRACQAIAEDALGFTEALCDMQERHSSPRRGGQGEGSAARDAPRGAAVRTTNPFRAAAEQWRSVAQRAAAAAADPRESAAPGGVGAVLDGAERLHSCAALLAALAEALQVEHGVVATRLEAAQQSEAATADAIARHQRVVEQVRQEAERRIEEMEADHDAEVQTLEHAIAELEQQVSVTAASKRPWTAGLFVQRRIDNPVASSPTSSHPRSSQETGGSRRESTGRAIADPFETARQRESRAAAVAVGRADAETQTPLSLELVQACMQKAREEPARVVRREKEAELVELMATEIETLRRQLTDSRAVTARLRAEQRRFLGDVTQPLSYFDNFSSFPAYV